MRFLKSGNVYKIIRITGAQDNILGICFMEPNSSEDNLEVIEWDFPKIYRRTEKTSKQEVIDQVLSGLETINKSLGTNYKLSKIYFSPYDISKNRVYSGLVAVLIRYYHNGNKFEEL
uniref:Uncharacterized protein n=1 Tax=Eunotia naegelii TaxID=1458866 RepID=A0A023JES3_9STRA|nr:hypothetical protein [Eunotia naegelii]YP_009059313.1 hypothetical protein [Eunotia naegelii]AHI51208.1 hypothetical protein [Eunotia naegelii]AHI51260.1 hypothetical protein [Eunotia naegelii]